MPMFRVPGQYTTDKDVLPSRKTLSTLSAATAPSKNEMARLSVKSAVERAAALAGYSSPEDEEAQRIIAEIRDRKTLLEPEQTRLQDLFRRLDNWYFPATVTDPGGADHWPEEKPLAGRAHVSINNAHVYVDVPAGLQSVVPIENYVPESVSDADQQAAQRRERLYFQWKDDEGFELKGHQACILKGLYGHTFGKVYWNAKEKRPSVTIIDNPERLYVGWGNSDFTRMDWAIYCYGLSPQAVEEDYGLTVTAIKGDKNIYFPYVASTHDDPIASIYGDKGVTWGRQVSDYEKMQVEVYDYWYKKVVGKGKFEVWNAIYVGNQLVKNERHPEYPDIPYVPLPNTYLPGSPYGRPELYDLEQLFREKDERITAAAQAIQSVIGGQMWQLVGPEAPDDVPEAAIPKPNKVAAPGPGNEIRAIQPFMPQFAIEDYLKRIDQELEVASGLNELLLGRAPAQILGSSKAIAALIANYEARISMKRAIYYAWRRRIWELAARVWESKDRSVKSIIGGVYRIEVRPPELTPRDELENAQKAINLVQNRIWSAKRAMDSTGVEDPEGEESIIKDEQTDPSLNPAAVQAQVTLLSAMRSLGVQPGAAGGGLTPEQVANTARQTNRPATGTPSLNGAENAANPPGSSLPANAQAGNGAKAQTLVQGGEATGRILTQTPLGG